MTSRQDLLEAQAYARRRLLAALIGGVPGDRAPEPPATARALLGGVVVAALVVLGAVVVALVR